MAVKNTKKAHPDSSTQRYLPFSQIRENIIIMKDDSARMVMRCSTVNFLLTTESIFSQILYFKVSNFIPFLSDCHCKISCEILAKYENNYSNKTNTSTSKLPLNYIWTNDSGVKFQEALNSPTMQDKIKMFLENSKSYTANDILKAVSDVENVILSAANMSLSKHKQKKKKKNNKKWFDNDHSLGTCTPEISY